MWLPILETLIRTPQVRIWCWEVVRQFPKRSARLVVKLPHAMFPTQDTQAAALPAELVLALLLVLPYDLRSISWQKNFWVQTDVPYATQN